MTRVLQLLNPRVIDDPSPSLDATFAALADPTRRAILARLATGAATVAELAEPFAMSQPAISKHLRMLERAGLSRQCIQAGMAHVNDSSAHDLPTSPFGGEKNSGIGRYNGQWAIEEFTTVHWISVQHVPIQYPF